MHEIAIQICYVAAGIIIGCTDGYISTDNPHIISQDFSPVYVYDTPKCKKVHHQVYSLPSVTIYSHRPPRTKIVHRRRHPTVHNKRKPVRRHRHKKRNYRHRH